MEERTKIDSIIEKFSDHWKITRMACVDRNILRIAVYELLYCADIPAKVSINEAIDVGKKYGSEDSGAFINGIADSVRFAMEKGELEVVPFKEGMPIDPLAPKADAQDSNAMKAREAPPLPDDGPLDLEPILE